ncbi:MAG: hypothetical protein E6H47_03580 [Betaproteobacteria bacterium]|nr:MAG: hypothetical protein E6H47_03580 [Betaproteobacteria bacterium]
MSASLRLSVIVVTLSLTAGCSTTRLAYDHADTWLRSRAGNYLDVHGEQADELKERIDAFHDWHRAKALPKYARLCEEAARRLGDGLSREDIVWGYDSLMAQVRETLRAAGERIAPMLDRLSPEQVRHMEKRFAEDNRKFARENLRGSEADRRKRRAARTAEQLEDWVGKLSNTQFERVRQFSERAPLYYEMRDRERKRLQGELLAMVRAREAQKRLPERAANFDQGRDPAYAAASEAARQEYYALLLDLDRMLSSEQRARAVANFRRYADDFTILARRAVPEPPPR